MIRKQTGDWEWSDNKTLSGGPEMAAAAALCFQTGYAKKQYIFGKRERDRQKKITVRANG